MIPFHFHIETPLKKKKTKNLYYQKLVKEQHYCMFLQISVILI